MARYRVGNGSVGNVGWGRLVHLVDPGVVIIPPVVRVWQPLPATGGEEGAPIDPDRALTANLLLMRGHLRVGDQLVRAGRWKRLPPKSQIIRENEPGNSLFFLAKGQAKASRHEKPLNLIGAGEDKDSHGNVQLSGSGALGDYEGHLYMGTSSWLSCHVPTKRTDLLHNQAALPSAVPGRYFLANEHEVGGVLVILRLALLHPHHGEVDLVAAFHQSAVVGDAVQTGVGTVIGDR